MSTLAVEPAARAVDVRCDDEVLVIQLTDGRTLSVPLLWFPRLAAAKHGERGRLQLIGEGEGIHWPDVDEDISVTGLLAARASVTYLRGRG